MENLSFFLNNKNGGDSITFGYRHRKIIVLVVFIFLIISSITGYFIYKNYNKKDNKSNILITKKKEEEKKDENVFEEKEIKIDIKGEINLPGMYSMSENSRIIDAINKAGGLTLNADVSVINLSKKLEDEMVIIIYSKEEVANFYEVKEKEKEVINYCIQKDDNSLKNDACIESNKRVSGKISLNSATKEELMTLKGIGEAKAKDIIRYREENGFFQQIEDIMKISGIGESLFAEIKEDITV